MGDPEKYTRRRKEQLAEERYGDHAWDATDELYPMNVRMQWPWGCAPSSISGLVVASLGVLIVALIAQSC